MSGTDLKAVPLHRALTRPQLFAGGEREPMLLLLLICFTLVFIGLSWFTLATALLFHFLGVLILRQMAKRDPLMTGVYRRHIVYGAWMPARPTDFAAASTPRQWH